MKVTDLINSLQECLDEIGDVEVFLHAKNKAYEFTYLGMGERDNMLEFWMTADKRVFWEAEESPEDFRAMPYKPDLKVVK